jgi:membrane AbrB-like protein
MPAPATQTLRRTIETLLIAGGGGILFNLAKFPAGWIAGSMICCAAAALAGRPLGLPNNLARAFYIVLGMSIGAVATPQTVIGMAAWPLSIAAVTVAMGAVTVGTVLYLTRVHDWETLPAVFAGTPGGLSQVMVLAAEYGIELRGIAIVQSMRVVILAVCVPAGLGLAGLAGPTRLPIGTVAIMDAPWELAILIALSVAVALAALRAGFPGGLIFGPMVVSGILHGGGYIHVTFPPWFASIAMVALGAVAGSRFTGTPFSSLLSYLGAAIGSFFVALVIAAAFALTVTQLLSLHVGDVVVAYAPGSIDAMMILALALHLDPVFVGALQLSRFLLVSMVVPFLAHRISHLPRKAKAPHPADATRPEVEDKQLDS